MARCGCSSSCACAVTGGTGIAVVGNGSAGSPYSVSVTAGSQGPQGSQGTQGSQGRVGLEGPQGSGAQGAQGAQGAGGSGGSGSDRLTAWYGADIGYDYEFDADAGPLAYTVALPSGWAWFNQAGRVYKEFAGAGVLSGMHSSGDSIFGITRSLAGAPASWTADAKVGIAGNGGVLFTGIALRESSSGKLLLHAMGDGGRVTTFQFSSPTSFTTDIHHNDMAHPANPMFLRIIKHSDTNFEFLYSPDGLAWAESIGNINPFLTPDQIGFFCNNEMNDPGEASMEWLRLR